MGCAPPKVREIVGNNMRMARRTKRDLDGIVKCARDRNIFLIYRNSFVAATARCFAPASGRPQATGIEAVRSFFRGGAGLEHSSGSDLFSRAAGHRRRGVSLVLRMSRPLQLKRFSPLQGSSNPRSLRYFTASGPEATSLRAPAHGPALFPKKCRDCAAARDPVRPCPSPTRNGQGATHTAREPIRD